MVALALAPVSAVAAHRGPYGRAGPFPRAAPFPHASPFVRAAPMPPPAVDRRPGHDAQDAARREVRAGNVHRLNYIERHVVPTMPGMQYLGPEYDPEAMAYRLKFIRDGRVVFVDVDARTGLVLGRTR